MREFRSHGSVRGASSNERPYREHNTSEANYRLTDGLQMLLQMCSGEFIWVRTQGHDDRPT